VALEPLFAAGSRVSWSELSETGNMFVFGFGMLVCATCVVCLLGLGIQEMFPHRHKRKKHKRRRLQQGALNGRGAK